MTAPTTEIKSCACSGLRPCLAHYDQLPPRGKRSAQMAAGVTGSWLAADGRTARTGATS